MWFGFVCLVIVVCSGWVVLLDWFGLVCLDWFGLGLVACRVRWLLFRVVFDLPAGYALFVICLFEVVLVVDFDCCWL